MASSYALPQSGRQTLLSVPRRGHAYSHTHDFGKEGALKDLQPPKAPSNGNIYPQSEDNERSHAENQEQLSLTHARSTLHASDHSLHDHSHKHQIPEIRGAAAGRPTLVPSNKQQKSTSSEFGVPAANAYETMARPLLARTNTDLEEQRAR